MKKKIIDKTGNQINTIYPYKIIGGGWSFDDIQVGLQGEPFVGGMSEIIDTLISNDTQFIAYISHSPIPDYTVRLIKILDDIEDNIEDWLGRWYITEDTGMKGWLCPATLKYFKNYPNNIYVKIEKFKL